MTLKYQNKYRIQSARLAGWDYGWDGAYFVTICTRGHICLFGEVIETENGQDVIMELSDLGMMANDCWLKIPKQFPFARLGVHVVMPNHMHGIVIIDKPPHSAGDTPSDTNSAGKQRGGFTGSKNPMLHDNLSRVIRWYKGCVTFDVRKIHPGFQWQSRFHDHIIRDGDEFERITDYIINNPRKWKRDRFNPINARDNDKTKL